MNQQTTDIAPPAPVPPPKKRTVKKRLEQTWEEEAPTVVGEQSQRQPLRVVAPEFEDDEEEEIDERELLLQELAEEESYMMQVYRLPNFERDGKRGIRAEREYCTTFPFDSNYLENIKKACGHGHFQIIIRDGMHNKTTGTVHIAAPPPVARDSSQAATATSLPQGLPVIDAATQTADMREYLKQFEMMGKMMQMQFEQLTMMVKAREAMEPKPSPPPPPAVPPQTREAVLWDLARGNSTLQEKVVTELLKETAPEKTTAERTLTDRFMDMMLEPMGEVIKLAVPEIVKGIAVQIAASKVQATTAPSQPPSQVQVQALPSPGPQPAPETSEEEQNEEEDTAMKELLNGLIAKAQKNAQEDWTEESENQIALEMGQSVVDFMEQAAFQDRLTLRALVVSPIGDVMAYLEQYDPDAAKLPRVGELMKKMQAALLAHR